MVFTVEATSSPNRGGALRPLSGPFLATLTISLVGGAAVPTSSSGVATVYPQVETPALYDDEAGGNANGDDPAIWVDPHDSAPRGIGQDILMSDTVDS
ncbi:hypothetical protein [Microbispora sp. KK1-11]|uniref:hypothetical protein n=1 Tax=Microbispora sp. KK1-11 TaxID=2053005 RepID=UPI001159B34F|nr:hypothetical protein [Microbispora sp. KK1-11]TQS26810.1 hypothetical protein FLW16_22675 [Microbispora sp. KK1-11]